MKTFQAEILTPRKVFFSGAAEALVLKGKQGYFGLLAGHAPLIARLEPGRLKLTSNGKTFLYRSGSGFVDVNPQRVSILVSEISEEP